MPERAPAYRFDSSWHLPASPDVVWHALVDRVEDWPSWWSVIRSTEVLEHGTPDGLGRTVRFGLRAPLGYRLAVQTRALRVVRPRVVEVDVAGQLAGRGRWELVPEPGGVRVHQLWEVSATRWWMRLLAPVARPLFRWSHDIAARRGERGLVRWLARGPSAGGG